MPHPAGPALHALCAVVLCLASACIAQADERALRIGVLTDMSGQYADGNGPGAVLAARIAVQDFGGTVLGRPIEIISADHQNKPDIGATIAREWLDTRGVDVIAEGVNSAVALAIQGVTRQRAKIFLISGAGSSDLTGRECSPTSVHWTYDTYASSNATAKALLARGGDKWFFLTADYAFGQALQRDASRAVKAGGGSVVGSVAHPFGTSDYSSYLLQAKSSDANVVAFADAGSDFANAAKQAVEFGLPQSGKQLAALQVTLTDVPAIGLGVMQGILFTESWYWNLSDETRAFAARFEAERHAKPTAYQAGVSSAVAHYLQAVRAAGTTEALTVMAKMRELPVNDFFAHGGVVRADGRMVHEMYLMRFKTPEQSTGKWDVYDLVSVIKGGDAFRPVADGNCSFLPPG